MRKPISITLMIVVLAAGFFAVSETAFSALMRARVVHDVPAPLCISTGPKSRLQLEIVSPTYSESKFRFTVCDQGLEVEGVGNVTYSGDWLTFKAEGEAGGHTYKIVADSNLASNVSKAEIFVDKELHVISDDNIRDGCLTCP